METFTELTSNNSSYFGYCTTNPQVDKFSPVFNDFFAGIH